MTTFEAKTFKIPELKGISKKTIDEHMKLYQGYVKHANLILEKMPEYMQWAEKDTFVPYYVAEIQRRFAFEFNGMRNHELYFEQFEGGPSGMESMLGESKLQKLIELEWGSFDAWLKRFKEVAMTRGIGWAILYKDPSSGRLLNAWVDEQHLGQLNSAKFILGLDMWEHSYMLDYPPSEKAKYIEAFFENLNWPVVLKRFDE